MSENAKFLLGCTYTLRMIHESSASLEHAILQSGYRWQPYVPTHFIYAFFAYNSLYNIDWEYSLSRRKPYTHNRNTKEWEKRDAYIDFCCENENFLRLYKDFFVRYVTARHSAGKIIDELEKIRLDRRYSNGNIRFQDDILSFQTACRDCLIDGKFDKRIVVEVEKFVYLIRCNLFHGAKTFDDLNNPSQQVRLDIYSAFVVAINQMVFSYLEYLKGDDITQGFNSLLDKLKWTQKTECTPF